MYRREQRWGKRQGDRVMGQEAGGKERREGGMAGRHVSVLLHARVCQRGRGVRHKLAAGRQDAAPADRPREACMHTAHQGMVSGSRARLRQHCASTTAAFPAVDSTLDRDKQCTTSSRGCLNVMRHKPTAMQETAQHRTAAQESAQHHIHPLRVFVCGPGILCRQDRLIRLLLWGQGDSLHAAGRRPHPTATQ